MTDLLPDPRSADRMLRRAVHAELRARRARVDSNERRKLLARANYLRAAAQEVFDELSRFTRERLSQ